MFKIKKKKEEKRTKGCGGDACELDFTSHSIKTDPQGMYTGVPENPYDLPVQDADDL